MKKWLLAGALVLIGFSAVLALPEKTVETRSVSQGSELYVALGDSVASGLGLATPVDTTGCGRTKEAYPHLLAKALDYHLLHLACTGATLDAGINGLQVAAGEQMSQRERLFSHDPQLISFAIGANDVTWLSRLSECLSRECGTDEDRTTYRAFLKETFKPQLRSTLEALGTRYTNKTRLLVVEYYQVFPKTGADCPDVAGLDESALVWARELRGDLNQAIYDTVKQTRVGQYVRIDFSGHELCTSQPWIQGLGDPAPYHANEAGQRAIAEQIKRFVSQTKN